MYSCVCVHVSVLCMLSGCFACVRECVAFIILLFLVCGSEDLRKTVFVCVQFSCFLCFGIESTNWLLSPSLFTKFTFVSLMR